MMAQNVCFNFVVVLTCFLVFSAKLGLSQNSTPCPFNEVCQCTYDATINSLSAICSIQDSNDFPTFTYYSTYRIAEITIEGNFSVIPDNSFYLLASMSKTAITIKPLIITITARPFPITLYDNSFLTVNSDGVYSLEFDRYDPINLSTMSNTQAVQTLTITGGGLTSIPNLKPFTSLGTVLLFDNLITSLQPGDFGLNTLTFVEISSSIFSEGKLSTLNSNAFDFTRLTYILALNNAISTMDVGFSKWLGSSALYVIDLEGNNADWQCDSNLQWMADFVICATQQIKVDKKAACVSGGLLTDFLSPYAKC